MFLNDAKIKNFTSCYKEQLFLEIFFRNLRTNTSVRFKPEFPFISYCGREQNYLKCDDLPFVVTHLDFESDLMQINNLKGASWQISFDANNVMLNEATGRLYYHIEKDNIAAHPDNIMLKRKLQMFEHLPCNICLIKSSISIELMSKIKEITQSNFEFEYKSVKYNLKLSSHDEVQRLLNQYSSYKAEEH